MSELKELALSVLYDSREFCTDPDCLCQEVKLAYMEAASPETILGLIEENEQLRAKLATLERTT